MPIALIYHHEERHQVEDVCAPLEYAGYELLYSPLGYEVGTTEWIESAVRELKRADAAILFITRKSAKDRMVAKRAEIMHQSGKPVYPVTLDCRRDDLSFSGDFFRSTLPMMQGINMRSDDTNERAIDALKRYFPKSDRRLKVFLCHGSEDKPHIRELYRMLKRDGLQPWLDEENLEPGDDWQEEVRLAVANSDIVLVCLTRMSSSRSGFIQKEIRIALDVADEKPERTKYLVPCKLEPCEIPGRLQKMHCVDLSAAGGYQKLLKALRNRAGQLWIK